MFLRSGFFDELIDERVVVEEFKLRYFEVLRNEESYLEIHKKLLSFEHCKYLNLKMKARIGLFSCKNESVASSAIEEQFARKDITHLTLGVTVRFRIVSTISVLLSTNYYWRFIGNNCMLS